MLFIGPEEIEPTFDAQSNSWRIGPFRVTLEQHKTINSDVHELVFDVQGEPPSVGYELCVRFDLPWKRCEWRGESGGGFVTLGPTDKGGDSLLGIAGSIFSAGEGLSAYSKRSNQRIDFAFDESGYCGLGRRTTLFARGMYNDKPDESLMRECLMRSTQTEATLYWYLLSNQQNFREALLDQAGARQWRFRCGVRTAIGKFNDVDLYHFAVGFNREAEVVDATIVPVATDWLTIGSSSVIVLGCQRRRNVTEVDVYNTSPESAHTRLRGELVNNASLTRADMLGFNCRHMQSRSLNLAPLEFAKVIIVDERSS